MTEHTFTIIAVAGNVSFEQAGIRIHAFTRLAVIMAPFGTRDVVSKLSKVIKILLACDTIQEGIACEQPMLVQVARF